jgi:molybdopterin-guanine dinucleotide biosynthesis protein A
MGGGDKTAIDVGGLSLLDRALEAVAGAGQRIVVGPARPTVREVRWTLEEPAGGGPAAALACGLRLVSAPVVLVLAGDLPFVTGASMRALREAAGPAGAVMVDSDDRVQWLLSCWPTALLRGALGGDQAGRSLHRQLGPLNPVRVALTGVRPEWFDCDEPADLLTAKELWDGPVGRLAP